MFESYVYTAACAPAGIKKNSLPVPVPFHSIESYELEISMRKL